MKPSSLLEGSKYKFMWIAFQITLVSWLSTNTEEEDLDDSATKETKMADEKKKFLEGLEEFDVEKEKSEKEKTDEEEEESSSSEEESDDGFDPNDSDDDVKKKGFMAKKVPPKRKAPAGRGRGEPSRCQWH